MTGNPIDRRDAYRMVARIAKAAGIPRHISPHSLRHAAITNALDAGCRYGTPRFSPVMPTREPPSTTTDREATSTGTACTSSRPTSQGYDWGRTPDSFHRNRDTKSSMRRGGCNLAGPSVRTYELSHRVDRRQSVDTMTLLAAAARKRDPRLSAERSRPSQIYPDLALTG